MVFIYVKKCLSCCREKKILKIALNASKSQVLLFPKFVQRQQLLLLWSEQKIGKKKKNPNKEVLIRSFSFALIDSGWFPQDGCTAAFLHTAFKEKHTWKLVFSAIYFRIHWCNYILASLLQNSSSIYSYTTHLTFLCLFCYSIPLFSNYIDQKT